MRNDGTRYKISRLVVIQADFRVRGNNNNSDYPIITHELVPFSELSFLIPNVVNMIESFHIRSRLLMSGEILTYSIYFIISVENADHFCDTLA